MNHSNQNDKAQNEDVVFYVRVQYRCNSSWQGTIQWMDGKKSSVFRSVLELGNLINDAKQSKSGGKRLDSNTSNWNEKESVS